MNDAKQNHRPLIGAIGAVGASLCGALILLFNCTPGPTGTDKVNYPIILTLDDKTNTTATFSGQPITVFCVFRDSVSFNGIGWHLGSGKMTRPRGDLSRIKTMQVPIYWESMPLTKDSSGRNYDSIYISLAGENNRSNGACVFVTNIPPVIDSIVISKRGFGMEDTLHYVTQAYDTLPTISIRIFAHDVNKNSLASLWSGSGSLRITPVTNSVNAYYRPPPESMTDTLALSVYDGRGGNDDKTIIITTHKNRPPIIDSVLVGDSLFDAGASATALIYSAVAFDSLHFRVWARDSDETDSIQIKWTNNDTKQASVRQKGRDMTWFCSSPTCNDTLRTGNDQVLDTVTLVVRDNAAGVTKTVIVAKSVISSDHPPVIDSVQCKDSLFRSDTNTCSYAASGLDTLAFFIYAHDQDSGDVLTDTVYSSSKTNITRLSERRFQFVCPDSSYTDTLTGVVRDVEHKSSRKKIAVTITKK